MNTFNSDEYSIGYVGHTDTREIPVSGNEVPMESLATKET